MTCLLQLLLTITAATVCAGCTALGLAAQQAEIRRIEQGCGCVHNPRPALRTPHD